MYYAFKSTHGDKSWAYYLVRFSLFGKSTLKFWRLAPWLGLIEGREEARREEEAKLKNERKLEGRKAKLASPRREQSMMGASDEVSISIMGVVRPQKSCALLRLCSEMLE